jgi:hypothetical protein
MADSLAEPLIPSFVFVANPADASKSLSSPTISPFGGGGEKAKRRTA